MSGRGEVVVGVDVGGTFTDVVLVAIGAAPVTAKVLTTPADPARGVRRGVERVIELAGRLPAEVTSVVHGTTLATNVILERRGARVAFVATEGFGDLFRLGREARVEEDRYDLRFRPPDAPIEAGHVVEAPERMLADGSVRTALSGEAAAQVAAAIARLQPEAVAVCLMHSWANPAHELLIGEALRAALPGVHVALSCELWPEMREYDRASTALLSAYVGPAMSAYLTRLAQELHAVGIPGDVWVMDSAGGVMTAEAAAKVPVFTVESGGAAGMVAAARVATRTLDGSAISFDMGGTTAKAGVIEGGRPRLTHDFQVGGKGSFGVARSGTGLPVKGPVVDLAEVGAGGGSIAWVDPAGALRVGPRSAGADPGPACYGRGGREPTVTDANLLLGFLGRAELSDGVELDVEAASAAMQRAVAGPMGIGILEAAKAVRAIAVAHMAAALRVVSVQRGLDPRDYALIAFGGAGPMHATELADTFQIARIVVPWSAGVASAHGLAEATPAIELVRTMPITLEAAAAPTIVAALDDLAEECRRRLRLAPDEGTTRPAIDLRYRGQAHQLTVDLDGIDVRTDGLDAVAKRFRERYATVYGIERDAPCEVVTYRVRVEAPPWIAASAAADWTPQTDAAITTGHVLFTTDTDPVEAAIVPWASLRPGEPLAGPAVITTDHSTVVVAPQWTAAVNRFGDLELERRT